MFETGGMKIKRIVQLLVQLAVLSGIIYYFFQRRDELSNLWDVGLLDVVSVLGLAFLGSIIRSWQLFYMVHSLDGKLSFVDSIFITTSTTLLNQLPMNTGTIFKAGILKKHYSIKYAHFISITGAAALLILISGGILGLMAVIFSGLELKINNITLIGIFVVSIIASVTMFCIPSSLIKNNSNWIKTAIKDLLIGLELIKRNGRLLLVLLALTASTLLTAALRLWVCFHAMNTKVSISSCILFAVIGNLLAIVNIVPGSLGLREILIGATAQFTGFSFDGGLFAAALDRIFSLILTVSMGLPSLVMLKVKKLI
ncbi:MAG: flippase-like domain-containing protein [Bacteroidetes bacterium]|nr:flippase-like domain-containing protein [Bacteroidota bacterium]